eukprot:scaffold376357_cov27-Prasinocladus_malaysianus.AAC.1
MPTPLGQDVVDGCDAICRGLDLNIVHGLHEAWRGHQERRVAAAPCCGDHLPPASVEGLGCYACVKDLVVSRSTAAKE